MRLLVDKGADLNKAGKSGYTTCTPLKIAIQRNHRGCADLLRAGGADGWTPLMNACYKGDVDDAKNLIELSSSNDNSKKDQKAALFVASEKGHYDIVQILIDNGVDFDLSSESIDVYMNWQHANREKDHILVTSITQQPSVNGRVSFIPNPFPSLN